MKASPETLSADSESAPATNNFRACQAVLDSEPNPEALHSNTK